MKRILGITMVVGLVGALAVLAQEVKPALNELNEKLTKGLSDFAKLGADEAIVKCLESDVAEFKRNYP